ncbi:hypothetical protein BH10BAC5_BH10BAC5_26380 [soil metagenome]
MHRHFIFERLFIFSQNMGKNKELRGTAKAASPYQTALLDIDVYLRKYTWIVIPILTLVYFLFSRVSTGFYQDDELGHFINMKDFWMDPGQIISNHRTVS